MLARTASSTLGSSGFGTSFQCSSQGQKQAAILTVARALLDPGVEPPRNTAALAASMVAIYTQLQAEIEIEIDTGLGRAARPVVLGTAGTIRSRGHLSMRCGWRCWRISISRLRTTSPRRFRTRAQSGLPRSS